MALYLEYLVRGTVSTRSALAGDSTEEALRAASEIIMESGCRSGLIRWTTDPGSIFGDGAIAASYSEADGWQTMPDAALQPGQ